MVVHTLYEYAGSCFSLISSSVISSLGFFFARLLLLATGVLAIVTRAGRGIFSGHVALVRYLVRRISAPDLRSTSIGRR